MNLWSKALVLGSAVAAVGVAAIAQTDAPPQVKRQILQRQDVAGSAMETVIGTAELPPGAAIGRHVHAGEEVGYVLRGPVTMKVDGQPDRVLKAGDSYAIARGVAHDARAEGEGAKVVAVWVVDKGRPLATAAD